MKHTPVSQQSLQLTAVSPRVIGALLENQALQLLCVPLVSLLRKVQEVGTRPDASLMWSVLTMGCISVVAVALQ